jgi:hypothetical protein
MNPDHLAAVWVEGDGEEYSEPKFATGYPIAPGLVLTVSHIFNVGWSKVIVQIPALSGSQPVTITRGDNNFPLVWDGQTDGSNGIDAVLFACDLPDGVGGGVKFLEVRPASAVDWFAYGYPEFVRPEGSPGEPFSARGEFSPPQTGVKFELDCTKYANPEVWGGASGGPIFLKPSNLFAGIFCGVCHHGGEIADDGAKIAPIQMLIGVPAWEIINAPGFRAVFQPLDPNREADFQRDDDEWYQELAAYMAAALQSDDDARVSTPFQSVFGEPLERDQTALDSQMKRLIRKRGSDRSLPSDLSRLSAKCSKLGINSTAEAIDALLVDLIPTMLTPDERRQIRDLLESSQGGFVQVTWKAGAAICIAAFGRHSLDDHSLSHWRDKPEDWMGPNGKLLKDLTLGGPDPIEVASRILDQLCSGELEQEERPEVKEIREQGTPAEPPDAAEESVEQVGKRRGALLNSRLEERRFDYGISFCVFKKPATVDSQETMEEATRIVSGWVHALKFLELSSKNTLDGVVPSFERLKLTHERRRKNHGNEIPSAND